MKNILLALTLFIPSLALAQGQGPRDAFPAVNSIINGGPDISQYNGAAAVTLTTSGVYVIDRWRLQYGGTFSAAPTAQFQESAPANGLSRYSMMFVGNATNSTGIYYADQRIESVNARRYAATGGTLSFYVYSQSADSVDIQVYYPTAIDNYASTTQVGATVTKTITLGGWQKLSTFIPANANYTKGMNVWIMFKNMTATGLSRNHYLSQVMLNPGAQAAPFSLAGKDIGDEWRAALRYYQLFSGLYGFQVAGNARTTTAMYAVHRFVVPMRVSPAVVSSNSSAYVDCSSGAASCTGNLFALQGGTTVSPFGANLRVDCTSGTLAVGAAVNCILNNASAYVGFNAEL